MLTGTEHGAAEAVSYRDLYYGWEKGQWAAGTIDLEDDIPQWAVQDPDVRAGLERDLALWQVAAVQAQPLLVPIVDAAPTEEQQVALTTQLVDLARHAFLFDRLRVELAGARGHDMASRTKEAEEQISPSSKALLLDYLPGIVEPVRMDPDDRAAFVAAIVGFHLVTHGLALVVGRRVVEQRLTSSGELNGFKAGLAAVLSDDARHREFAVRFLRDALASDAGRRETVRESLRDGTAVAMAALKDHFGDRLDPAAMVRQEAEQLLGSIEP